MFSKVLVAGGTQQLGITRAKSKIPQKSPYPRRWRHTRIYYRKYLDFPENFDLRRDKRP